MKNDEKWYGELIHSSVFGWALFSAWKNVDKDCLEVLDKGDYPENAHVVSCPNKQRYFEPFMCLDLSKRVCNDEFVRLSAWWPARLFARHWESVKRVCPHGGECVMVVCVCLPWTRCIQLFCVMTVYTLWGRVLIRTFVTCVWRLTSNQDSDNCVSCCQMSEVP